MKKSLLYILCLALLTGACMQDQTNPMTIGTCYDGIKNQDEKAIDCGGKCTPCFDDSSAPCSAKLKNNVFTTSSSTFNVKGNDYYSELYYSRYTFSIKLPSNGINITLGESTLPTKDKVYRNIKNDTPEEGYASVTYYTTSSDYTYEAESGNVYVSVRNGKIAAELCSLVLTNYYYGQYNTITLSGRIVSK